CVILLFFFFFQAEDGIRDFHVTGVQTCALPILDCSHHQSTNTAAEAVNAPSVALEVHPQELPWVMGSRKSTSAAPSTALPAQSRRPRPRDRSRGTSSRVRAKSTTETAPAIQNTVR